MMDSHLSQHASLIVPAACVSPAPSALDHSHHAHYHHSLLHPVSNLSFGEEDSTPIFHDVNGFCGRYDAVGRFVGHVEDHSLDLDLDHDTGSADSSSYDMHHGASSVSYTAAPQHYLLPQHQQPHYISAAPIAQYQVSSFLADQWLQHDDEPTVSSPGSDDCWGNSAVQQTTVYPAQHYHHHHQQQLQQQPQQQLQQYSAPARLAIKRSASDAGLSSSPLEYNPKRVKTEASTVSAPQPAVAAVLDTNNLVAAYQQLLLMQLQQVQALMGAPAVGSTAPHSPVSGGSSSSSSAPPSPIKMEPTSPSSVHHSHHSRPTTPVEAVRDPTYHAPHRERRVRPKVVPEKGGVQCQGFNRKKNVRCRNAALMEYMGPRPSYCAEHIHLDPECLYTKCQSTFHTSPEDGKGCREVVLKEFGFCHKHFEQFTAPLSGVEGLALTNDCLSRVEDCLGRLSLEAQSAKKVDPDLFQRKHKLIPKFVQMKTCLTRHVHLLTTSLMPPQTEAALMTTFAPVSYYQLTPTTH